MAFHDWNYDGKKDFTDDFIEYQIYTNSTNKQDSDSSLGGWVGLLIAIIIGVCPPLGIVILLVVLLLGF